MDFPEIYLRMAGFQKESVVDGDGMRFVLFLQGCSNGCKGCQNKETWDFNGGELWKLEDVYREIRKFPWLNKVTFSGGDPIFQAESLYPLAKRLKEEGYDLWLYTGFLYEEIKDLPLVGCCDVLVDGRFEEEKKSLELRYKGSSNQRIIDLNKTREKGNIQFYIV